MEKKPVEKRGTEQIGTPRKPSAAKRTEQGQTAVKSSAARGNGSAKSAGNSSAANKRKKKKALRRRRIIRRTLTAFAALAVVAAVVVYMTHAVIGGRIYPLSSQSIDLRGMGLTNIREVARMNGLNEIILADNQLSDVTSLGRLTDCDYIDLTGNPVSTGSYMQLRDALPDCLILCDAEDYSTTELSLGGYSLPDTEALAAVFESHKALKTVDLRGAGLSVEEIDVLQGRFPQIDFICAAEGEADTLVLNVDSPADAAQALSGVNGAGHVTVTGCTFTPEEYRALQDQFLTTTLDCRLSLYGKAFLLSDTEIDLTGCETDDTLAEKLGLFTGLHRLTIGEAIPSEAAAMKADLGLEEIAYTYCGRTISPETTEIDLRGIAGLDANELQAVLSVMPLLTSVSMDTPDEAMASVIAAYKGSIRFEYDVTAFGKTFSSTSESIDLADAVNDDNVAELMSLIDRMPLLSEALMYDSRISQENMDLLFDRYPDVFFGWTFTMCDGEYVVRTDVTAFSTLLGWPTHVYTQDNFTSLRFCKNLQALDLGHNAITDISFLSSLTKIKLLILADNQITDITPLASMTDLQYVELFMNEDLQDYSPLEHLKLTDLNVRKGPELNVEQFTGMTTLKRFWATNDQLERPDIDRLCEALPDCEISITSGHSTDNGWRDTDIYEAIVEMFDSREYQPFR